MDTNTNTNKKLAILVAEYKSKSIAALETMTMEELEYLISEAKKDMNTHLYMRLFLPI